jgi:outer membrane protein TolC
MLRRSLKHLLSFLALAIPLMAEPVTNAPLTLDQAIQLALAKNYTIQVQAVGRPIARAGLTEAYGKFDPRLEGSYSSGRDKTPFLPNPLTGLRPDPEETRTTSANLGLIGLLPTGLTYNIGGNTLNQPSTSNGFLDTYNTFAGVSLTQPLLRDAGLGATLIQVRLARTNSAISEWDYRQTVTDTITQVVYAYSDYYFAQSRLRIAQRSRDLAAQLHKDNERRRDVQVMSDFDVLSASAKVAEREDGVLQAESAVYDTENTLKQLITDERQPALLAWDLAIEPPTTVATTAPDPATDFPKALQQRPDYQLAQLAVKRGDLNRRYALNQMLPRVDATGSYGYNGVGSDFPSSRKDARTRDFPAYSAGVNISVPLTFAAERGRYRSSKLLQKQAELQLQQLEQSIVVDLGNAAQQVESTRRRVAVTRDARRLNEEMLQAELKRLRAGTGSTFSVLNQQAYLSSAEISEAGALADHSKALAEYDRQAGRTLEARHIVIRAD